MKIIAIMLLLFAISASAEEVCPTRTKLPLADDDYNVPECLPVQAAKALEIAKRWHSDAVLIRVEVLDIGHTGKFEVRFSFYSSSHSTGLWVSHGRPTPAGLVNWGATAIPMNFMDLYPAVKQARKEGMDTPFDQAVLYAWPDGIAWRITPVDDPDLRIFEIRAARNLPMQSIPAKWQTSWAEFVKEVQKQLAEDPGRSEFDSFIAKVVHWQGRALKLTKREQSSLTLNMITMRMPDAMVNLPNGGTLQMQNPIEIVSDVTATSGKETTITPINQKVRFSARIIDVHRNEKEIVLHLIDGQIEEKL